MVRPAVISVAIFVVGFAPLSAQPADPPKRTITVFKTASGAKYHRQECRYCRRGEKFIGQAIDLDAARRSGLTPCKVCKPEGAGLAPPKLAGKVVGVTDGDTITVLVEKMEHKVRLEGIDAPERKQAFGSRAKQALSDKVYGKEVSVAVAGKDRYGRLLGHIYLGKRWINLEMVQDGFAWHFKRYSTDKNLSDAETAARAGGKGLWADKKPVSPWEYRKKKRK